MKTLLQFIIGLAICFGVAFWLRIDPADSYGWFMGIIHGLLLVPNWLISLFDHSWLVKADNYTQMYNIDWWVFGIINILYWLWVIAGLLVGWLKPSRSGKQ